MVETTDKGVPGNLSRHVRKEVQAPMVYSVRVEATGGARAEVAEFVESDFCRVRTEAGDAEVAKVKSAAVEVESESGDVTCVGHIQARTKVIHNSRSREKQGEVKVYFSKQGTVKIKTRSGNVIGDKRFTGDALEIATDSGDIRLASCYSDTSSFYTNTGRQRMRRFETYLRKTHTFCLGSLYLRNLHNESYMSVYEKGKVTVLGLDGSTSIFVKRGEVDCQVSVVRHESRIHVEEGDIHLRISEQHPLKLHIDANEIIPDAKFKVGTTTVYYSEASKCAVSFLQQ